jgi:peptidoglycan/LPS O-acetylase OafA/YrhL
MDSLFFGVLLGYLHHFRPDFLNQLLAPALNRVALTFLAVALLSCALILPVQHPLMLTAGLTLLYVGFGIVLILSLRVHGVLPVGFARLLERIGTPLAYLGMYSYSIYLWHQPFGGFGPGVVRHVLHIQLTGLPKFLFNFVGCIMFGIVISRLIEYPILRMRDRAFPVMQVAARTEHSNVADKRFVAAEKVKL